MTLADDKIAWAKAVNGIVPDPRQEWLEKRKHGLGGSDAAAAIGASPWKSPLALHLEKTGQIEPDDIDAELAYWGHHLEAPIRDRVARDLGIAVAYDEYGIRTRKDAPHLIATLDGEFPSGSVAVAELFGHDVAGPGVLEIKTSGQPGDWVEGEWPANYQVQVQHELLVMGYEWAVVAVLIAGKTFKMLPVRRDAEFLAALEPTLGRFWEGIQTRTPPAVDYHDATTRALKKLHPKDNNETIVMSAEASNWDGEITILNREVASMQKRIKELRNCLMAEIGDNTFGELLGGGRWSWKHQTFTRQATEEKEIESRPFRRLKK